MTFLEYADAEMMAIDVANVLAGALEKCLFQHEWASFAVPGGSTPGPIFDVLCAADLDWSRVHVTLTDERWVSLESERSNWGLLRRRLLVNRAAEAVFRPLYVPGATPEEGAAQVSAELVADVPISVLLLGMGADMHTASLFPGAQGLREALAPGAPIVCPIRPAAQEERVTLSAATLDGAMSKHLVITGAEKRAAFEAARKLPFEEAPIAAVKTDLIVHWAP
ncbi:MAG: 6-phosphogluconolactonase [Pseudomonadota bacterium]